MIILDATNLLIGRIATYVSKQLLLGEEVNIVNSEKAIVSGPRKRIVEKYRDKRERGHPYAGPFFPTREDMILNWSSERIRERQYSGSSPSWALWRTQ